MDRITKEHRSWNMSRIRSKDTKPEITVRKYLYARGIRYRLHAQLPGRPDIVMKKRRIAVFVNGCFWHGHTGCKYFRLPKTRNTFWSAKINGTVSRDIRNYESLEKAGWKCKVIWECQIKHDSDNTLDALYNEIISGKP